MIEATAHEKATSDELKKLQGNLSPAPVVAVRPLKPETAPRKNSDIAENSKVERRQGPRMIEVVDKSCTSHSRTREHEILMDGDVTHVKFEYGKKMLLPFSVAMKFQKDGFELKDEDGNVFQRTPESTVETIVSFGPEKVVAHITELTQEAVYVRAAMLPGGEKFKPASPKEKMVEFLIESARQKLGSVKPAGETIEEMSENELENLGLAAE